MSITLASKVYTYAGMLVGRISRFTNRESGIPSGFRDLTVVVDDPGASDTYKVRWKLKLPSVIDEQDCSCPDGMVRMSFADIVVSIHKGSTAAERTLMAQSLEDLVATPEFSGAITNLEQPAA